ncbi:GNAT family N-acetyltransferase [Actinocorallia sp. API 0066]|uniref:GNAT family N-acetyltransferase n=1 Tax=Actinocorallia sp. API 0066 TaxID=2896846 RepID=UPI001E479C4C|nr:GNAT family N-acetyltransferase [Actinocorallia sp. API 0066]MCD0452798.1 GNAT family N-acetyltransferase [Actinocorallia sp. API 0066]
MAAIGSGARTLVRRPAATPEWTFGDLHIRRYRPADHRAVVSLHREGLARIGLRPGDGVYYEDDLFMLERIYLEDGRGEFLVGVLPDGEPVAMGGLRRVDEQTGEMVRLRVRHDLHRHGYGAALLQALEERALDLGYPRLTGDTTELQGPALELYRAFGWVELRRELINGIVNIYGEKKLL